MFSSRQDHLSAKNKNSGWKHSCSLAIISLSPYTVHPWWYEIIFDIEWWLLWPGLSLHFVDNSPVLRGRWMEINFQHLIYSMFLYHQNLEENSNKTNTKKIAINRDEQPAANPSSFCRSSPQSSEALLHRYKIFNLRVFIPSLTAL